jgi:hypothetical protein
LSLKDDVEKENVQVREVQDLMLITETSPKVFRYQFHIYSLLQDTSSIFLMNELPLKVVMLKMPPIEIVT